MYDVHSDRLFQICVMQVCFQKHHLKDPSTSAFRSMVLLLRTFVAAIVEEELRHVSSRYVLQSIASAEALLAVQPLLLEMSQCCVAASTTRKSTSLQAIALCMLCQQAGLQC